jgi:YVTN family beta-propeller protein
MTPSNCLNFGVTAGNVVVVDGTTDEIIGDPIQVGAEPGGFAINQVTNTVYVYNFFSDSISVINGSTDALTTNISVGHLPDGIDVNPCTNKVYVANSNYCADSGYEPGLTIIDGSDNSVLVSNLTLDSSTPTPWAVVADPISNKIYVSNANESAALNCNNPDHLPPSLPGPSTITVVDGSANSVIHTLSAPSGITWTGNDWGVLNPAKNKLYFSNAVSANVTVVDAATDQTETVAVPNLAACYGTLYTDRLCANEGCLVVVNPATSVAYVGETGCCYNGTYLDIIPESSYSIVPLLSSITPTTDSHTISTSPVFVTSNTTPSFTFSGYSTYSTYSPYTSLSVTEPPPTALYYAIDTMESTWSQATLTSSAGANPASFSATMPTLTVRAHILYVYSAYGREGSAEGEANNGNSSPEIGNLATEYFVVVPAT